MAWRRVPKDKDEQMLWSMPRGSPKEEDVHRLRYGEVGGWEGEDMTCDGLWTLKGSW